MIASGRPQRRLRQRLLRGRGRLDDVAGRAQLELRARAGSAARRRPRARAGRSRRHLAPASRPRGARARARAAAAARLDPEPAAVQLRRSRAAIASPSPSRRARPRRAGTAWKTAARLAGMPGPWSRDADHDLAGLDRDRELDRLARRGVADAFSSRLTSACSSCAASTRTAGQSGSDDATRSAGSPSASSARATRPSTGHSSWPGRRRRPRAARGRAGSRRAGRAGSPGADLATSSSPLGAPTARRLAEQLGRGPDRGQRRAQVVADRAQHRVLAASLRRSASASGSSRASRLPRSADERAREHRAS